MDIQNILTTAIEIVFMGFVSLMVYDFIDGLWVVPLLPAPETIDTPSRGVSINGTENRDKKKILGNQIFSHVYT
ncbi:hypothetical protein KBT16_02210 [Nostoc sp. CCCryo 231-06]|nr:hypothetical protein [Nostoc sp. CCCryo 231-06]